MIGERNLITLGRLATLMTNGVECAVRNEEFQNVDNHQGAEWIFIIPHTLSPKTKVPSRMDAIGTKG